MVLQYSKWTIEFPEWQWWYYTRLKTKMILLIKKMETEIIIRVGNDRRVKVRADESTNTGPQENSGLRRWTCNPSLRKIIIQKTSHHSLIICIVTRCYHIEEEKRLWNIINDMMSWISEIQWLNFYHNLVFGNYIEIKFRICYIGKRSTW